MDAGSTRVVKSSLGAVFCFVRGFGTPVRFDQEWAMVSAYYFGAVEESDVPLDDGLANFPAAMGTFCRTSAICIE